MTDLPPLLRRGALAEGWAATAVGLGLALAVYAASLGYAPLNHGPNRVFLRTRVDEAIPLVPVFAVPYVSLDAMVAGSLVVMLLVRSRVLRSAALAMLIAFGVSYVVYAVAQSYVARPVVTGDDALSALVRRIHSGDQPYNDFPSLHTSLSVILAVHWLRLDRRLGAAVSVWLGLIVVSTLLVHQHYLADLAGGAVLGLGASWLGWRLAGVGGWPPAPAQVPKM